MRISLTATCPDKPGIHTTNLIDTHKHFLKKVPITSRMRIQGSHSYKRKSAQNSPECSRQGNYVAHPKVSRGSNQVSWECKHCGAMHCVRNTVLETQRGRLGALQTNSSWFPGFSASQFHNETLPPPRLEICRDRHDRRSCKIFVSCVNFSKKQRGFLLIWQVYTHLNANFIHNC